MFKSPVALHVEALTESMRTLHRLKAQQAPLTPQCEQLIKSVTKLASSQQSPDGAIDCTKQLAQCPCFALAG